MFTLKYRWINSLLVGLVGLLLFSPVLGGAGAARREIRVPQDFPTIQEAIEKAAEGDIILVDATKGPYNESIVTGRWQCHNPPQCDDFAFVPVSRITLRSVNGRALIDGQGEFEVVRIIADEVYLSGFEITAGDMYGILVEGVKGIVLSDNLVTHSTIGIALITTSESQLVGNTIKANEVGLLLEDSAQNDIQGNLIQENAADGVQIAASHGNSLHRNTVETNGNDGMFLAQSTGNTLKGNTIRTHGGAGIRLIRASENTLEANTIVDNEVGIELVASDIKTITHNTITENAVGIRVGVDINDVRISWNNIEGNVHFGVLNATVTEILVDATENWWGHPSGPGGKGPGQGDAVSAYVHCEPWLQEPVPSGTVLATTQPAGYYLASILQPQPGPGRPGWKERAALIDKAVEDLSEKILEGIGFGEAAEFVLALVQHYEELGLAAFEMVNAIGRVWERLGLPLTDRSKLATQKGRIQLLRMFKEMSGLDKAEAAYKKIRERLATELGRVLGPQKAKIQIVNDIAGNLFVAWCAVESIAELIEDFDILATNFERLYHMFERAGYENLEEAAKEATAKFWKDSTKVVTLSVSRFAGKRVMDRINTVTGFDKLKVVVDRLPLHQIAKKGLKFVRLLGPIGLAVGAADDILTIGRATIAWAEAYKAEKALCQDLVNGAVQTLKTTHILFETLDQAYKKCIENGDCQDLTQTLERSPTTSESVEKWIKELDWYEREAEKFTLAAFGRRCSKEERKIIAQVRPEASRWLPYIKGLESAGKDLLLLLKPDLALTAIGANQKARCSWEAAVWTRVKNMGNTPARGVLVSFFVDGTRLSTTSSFDLDPGQEKTVSTPWRISTFTCTTYPCERSYTLYARVDPDNALQETNETNNELRKGVRVEVVRECVRTGSRCVTTQTQCVREECVRREPPHCCGGWQSGQCRSWCEGRCLEWRCVEWRDVCVRWEEVCLEYRECPKLLNPQPLTGQASQQPWSGWWWPLRNSAHPNMYDEGGPLDKYDKYVLTTRGYNPGAREWEAKAQGSTLMVFTIEVQRDDLKGSIVLGKHGNIVDDETLTGLDLLKVLITGITPQDQIEEQIKRLEETMFVGGLWWQSFKGDIPSLGDLLAKSWDIKNESKEEAGEAAGWMGICHGLAAASVMEEEPTQPRTLHGIDFTVADLKALLTKAWQEAYFESWETSPKNFHEKLQEIVGGRGKPLIMDLARGRVAANHPAYQYEITKVKEEGPTATFEAKVWFAGYSSPEFVGTTSFTRTYVYSLTFDDQWKIMEDGIWISADYPDSIWIPTAPRPGNPRIDLEIVREIIGR